MGRRKQKAYPRTRPEAELVMKHGWECSTNYSEVFAPSVSVLGNRNGFLWLSDYFAWIADRISEDAVFCREDPTDHQHLDSDAPVNHRLSDEIGLSIGAFSNRHRRRVFKACGITQKARRSGSPIAQFVGILDEITELPCNYWDNPGTAVRDLERLIQQAQKSIAKLNQAAKDADSGSCQG